MSNSGQVSPCTRSFTDEGVSAVLLVDRECVRRLMEAPEPDAVLVYIQGECVVRPEAELDAAHRRLVIARRTDLPPQAETSDQQLDLLANRLDNVARDLGA